MEEVSNVIQESKIRRGGKQASGKPALKHTIFYYCFGLNKPESEELKSQIKGVLTKLSDEIENNILILQGSQQGHKNFNLPINDTREKLKLRIEGIPKVKFFFEVGKQTNNLYIHYLFAVSKRGLDTQVDNKKVKEFFDKEIGFVSVMKSQIYRDAKCDLAVYAQKASVI